MPDEHELIIRTTLMPAAELERLLNQQRRRFPNIVVLPGTGPADRGVLSDPQVVSAAITGITTIVSALIPALIARFFSEEPKATIEIVGADGHRVTLRERMSEDERLSIITTALIEGTPQALEVRIDPD